MAPLLIPNAIASQSLPIVSNHDSKHLQLPACLTGSSIDVATVSDTTAVELKPDCDAPSALNGCGTKEDRRSHPITKTIESGESSQFLHAALDSIPSKLAILDESGTIVFVNKKWKCFVAQDSWRQADLGVGEDFFLSIRDTMRLASSDADIITSGIHRILQRECETFEHDYRFDSLHEIRWFRMHISCFESSGLTRLVVAIQNISASKQAQEKLERLNEQLTDDVWALDNAEEELRKATDYLDVYRKIVDHHAIVAETDTAGTIISVNDAFCRISGYSREELIGQNHRIVNSGLHPKSHWKNVFKTIAKEGFWHGEICNRNKSGKLYWVDSTIASLRDDKGKIRGYFAIRADITSLKEAQAQAESANRSKSEFLANMSHEIRTPMTAILGYADILADGCDQGLSTESSVEFIETIKRNGEHLLAIINDVLDISKIEADKMTAEIITCSPTRIVDDVVELMKVKSTAKGLQLETQFDDVPEMILTDPTRLRQILVNLVGNAIKFTEIGSVKIAVHRVPGHSELLCFDVIDTGIGLTEKQIGKLFQAFEQADTSMTRKFGGTGLGLRISKRLAQILGGDITVQGKERVGCVFSATVATGSLDGVEFISHDPADVAHSKHSEANSASTSAVSTKPPTQSLAGIRVLLAEDGPDNQRLIAFHLRKAGAEVEIVENGKMAIERLTSDQTLDGELNTIPPVDIVLMDMQMPELDGYQATEILRRKGCELPILALTAHAMDIDLDKCIRSGCNIRLTKPIEKLALLEACAHWGNRTE